MENVSGEDSAARHMINGGSKEDFVVLYSYQRQKG
jgi:hypothetical protein